MIAKKNQNEKVEGELVVEQVWVGDLQVEVIGLKKDVAQWKGKVATLVKSLTKAKGEIASLKGLIAMAKSEVMGLRVS